MNRRKYLQHIIINIKNIYKISLVVQWLRIHCPMQEVWSLVGELRAHMLRVSYWAYTLWNLPITSREPMNHDEDICAATKTLHSQDTFKIYIYKVLLFTIPKTWKQPESPLTDEWIKMWYIYTVEYYSVIKKNEWNNSICSNMDPTRDYHTKSSRSERDKYHMIYYLTHGV